MLYMLENNLFVGKEGPFNVTHRVLELQCCTLVPPLSPSLHDTSQHRTIHSPSRSPYRSVHSTRFHFCVWRTHGDSCGPSVPSGGVSSDSPVVYEAFECELRDCGDIRHGSVAVLSRVHEDSICSGLRCSGSACETGECTLSPYGNHRHNQQHPRVFISGVFRGGVASGPYGPLSATSYTSCASQSFRPLLRSHLPKQTVPFA